MLSFYLDSCVILIQGLVYILGIYIFGGGVLTRVCRVDQIGALSIGKFIYIYRRKYEYIYIYVSFSLVYRSYNSGYHFCPTSGWLIIRLRRYASPNYFILARFHPEKDNTYTWIQRRQKLAGHINCPLLPIIRGRNTFYNMRCRFTELIEREVHPYAQEKRNAISCLGRRGLRRCQE